jgi:hypothetical protein
LPEGGVLPWLFSKIRLQENENSASRLNASGAHGSGIVIRPISTSMIDEIPSFQLSPLRALSQAAALQCDLAPYLFLIGQQLNRTIKR